MLTPYLHRYQNLKPFFSGLKFRLWEAVQHLDLWGVGCLNDLQHRGPPAWHQGNQCFGSVSFWYGSVSVNNGSGYQIFLPFFFYQKYNAPINYLFFYCMSLLFSCTKTKCNVFFENLSSFVILDFGLFFSEFSIILANYLRTIKNISLLLTKRPSFNNIPFS